MLTAPTSYPCISQVQGLNDLSESYSYLDTFSCWSPEHFPNYKRERTVQILSVEAYIFSPTSSSLSAEQTFRYKLVYVLEMGVGEWSIRIGKCLKQS